MTVEGICISGAPIRNPLIMASSEPSWLEWNNRTSTLPFSALFTSSANLLPVTSKSEPGKPTWPSLMVMVFCASAAADHRASVAMPRTTNSLANFMILLLLVMGPGSALLVGNAGRLDDLTPFFHFRAYIGKKLFGRAGGGFVAQGPVGAPDVRQAQYPPDLAIQPVDDGGWCAGAGHYALPGIR